MSLRPLVGRSRELADLDEALARAASGRGNLVLLSGEPGIGKTRLAEELAERAEATGATVCWARAWEVEGAPPLAPWLQVVRACAPDSDALASAAADDPELALVAHGAAVVDVLRRACAAAVVVVVLDDLHAADFATLAVLERVAVELRSLRVLLVATHREVDARANRRLAALLGRVARRGAVRPLGRLDEAAVAAWLAAGLGSAPTPALIARVFTASEGNPLFVDAVVQLLAARGDLGPGVALPGTIRAAVHELVARVPAAARAVIECAAVLGRECDVAALAVMARSPPEAIAAAVEAAIAAGVVEAQPRPSSPVRFVHVLVREAIYQDLPAARRLELHAAARAALARLHASALEEHLAELAHHAFESAAGWADAAELAERAGRRALALGAFDDAAHHLARALIAFDRAEIADRSRRIELLLAHGEALIRTGNSRAGRDSCERAAALADEAGRGDLYAHAALSFGLELVPGRVVPRLIELLEAALTREPDAALRALVMSRLAAALLPTSGAGRPEALARQAIAAGRALGQPRILARVLVNARAAFTPAEPLEALQAIDREVVGLAAVTGDRLLAVQAHGRLALVAMAQGDAAEVALQLALQHRLADQLGVPQQEIRAASHRLVWATATADLGAIDDAERRIRELADRVDDARGLAVIEANRYTRAQLVGDFAAAAAALERLEHLVMAEPLWSRAWRPILARLVERRARPARRRARRAALAVARRARGSDARDRPGAAAASGADRRRAR